jgi:methyl-accepting chemotaxis protein
LQHQEITMNKVSGIKISHKITSLMVGLIAGFMIMGVAYYAQISTEIKREKILADYTRAEEHLKQMHNTGAQLAEAVQQPNLGDTANAGESSARLAEQIEGLGKLAFQFYSAADQQALRDLHQAVVTQLQTPRDSLALPPAAPLTGQGGDQTGEETTTVEETITGVTEPATGNQESLQAQLTASVQALAQGIEAYQNTIAQSLDRRIASVDSEKSAAQWLFAAALFLTAAGTALGLFLIYRSIVLPLWHMQGVIAQQNRGNDKARVRIQARDELGELGAAFNRLLDERIQVLREQSAENEQLNNSIIGLIRALGTIAKKDLSIKVPVSADVTGTISDAVNLLTSETARTLHQMRGYAEKVNRISDQLQHQSHHVLELSEAERREVTETLAALDQAARAMNHIAREARITNSIASAAIDHTLKARTSVGQTLEGIQTIRGTLSETEKRIKRLGDRSQEITGIVNLINTIAERTHILALNASMHAASAGEAGKGFAVVAEEVQRLAENARAATSEIATMVNNIRVETSDAAAVLNKLISQVAEGTRMAEDSGQRMQDTEAATRQLVNHVKSIAVHSVNQAKVSQQLHERAEHINASTEETSRELEAQHQQTDALKEYAKSLMEQVMVFTLPEFRASDRPTDIRERQTQDTIPAPGPITIGTPAPETHLIPMELPREKVANG